MLDEFPGVAAQALVVAAVLFAFGLLLARALIGGAAGDRATLAALAFPALVAFALLLALAHMATGGAVFSEPWIVRAATGLTAVGAALVVAMRRGRERALTPAGRATAVATGVVLAGGLALWCLAVAHAVPVGRPTGDTAWQMGWANQLLAGETIPSTVIAGAIPNYYPWLFHALTAFVAAFTPGGTGYHALAPLQLLQVAGAILALAALGRAIARHWAAGAGTATFGALAMGFGFALLPAVERVAHTPRTGGPRGTYAAALNNLPAPLPRDLGYALLLAVLVLLALAASRRSRRLELAAGVVLGLCGLASAEFFFAGLGVAGLVTVFAARGERVGTGARLLLPAVGVYLLWVGPLIASYRRLGGFVNTTAVDPIALSPLEILMTWGPSTILGAYGFARLLARARADRPARLPLLFLVACSAILLAVSAIPAVLGEGFEVLGRAPRSWPVLQLAVGILAGIGAGDLVVRAARAGRVRAGALAAVILVLALPFSVAIAVEDLRTPPGAPVLARTMLGEPSVFSLVAGAGSRECVVAAPHSVGFRLWSYTGFRLVAYLGRDVHLGNYARIRWRDIYRTIPSDAERLADNDLLLDGATPPARWRTVADRYGVDLVVVPEPAASGRAFEGLDEVGRDGPLVVLSRDTC